MKKRITWLCRSASAAFAAGAIFLAGCQGGPYAALGPEHDVAWFKAHNYERKSVLSMCENDPGRYLTAPNCQNSAEAEKEVELTAPDEMPRLPAKLKTQSAGN